MKTIKHLKTQVARILGFLLFGLILYSRLIHQPQNQHLLKQFSSEPAQLNWLFFMLPIGSLWEKFSARFSSKKADKSKLSNGIFAAYAKALAKAQDHETAKNSLLRAIQEILKTKAINLYWYEAKGLGFQCENHKKHPEILPEFIPASSLIPEKLEKSTGVKWFENNDPTPKPHDPSQLEEKQAVGKVNLLTPINNHDQLFGWILTRPSKYHQNYTQSDIELLEFLTQLSPAVYQKTNFLQSLQSQVAQGEVCNRIEESVKLGKDLNLILQEVYEHLRKFLPVHTLSMILRDPEQLFFKRIFTIRDEKLEATTLQPEALHTEFLEKSALATGQITSIEEKSFWLVLPLAHEEAIIGALSLGHSYQNDIFEDLDLNFLQNLASAVTTAAQSHHLEEANQRQKQQLEVIKKAGRN